MWSKRSLVSEERAECFPAFFLEELKGYSQEKEVWVRSPTTSARQSQTSTVFGYKWKKQDTFSSPTFQETISSWMREKYGCPEALLSSFDHVPILLDAGCGAGVAGLGYWGPFLERLHYVGMDISEAIFVAHQHAAEKKVPSSLFIRDDLSHLPFKKPLFDIIFSEGVLHHTDSTERTFSHLCQFLKPGGYFMFYVYRKKAPLREFTDDYIREQLVKLPAEKAWEAVRSLTELGKALGDLDIEIDIPEEVKILGIPKGHINLQRLFYWYIFKCYYRPDFTLDEMQHINFDWYAPQNAFRHTEEEVREWCINNGLKIVREKVELAGITITAQKC